MKKNDIKETILGVVAITGLITLAVLAPNTIQALKFLVKKKYYPSYIRQKVKELAARGLVKFTKQDRGTFISLTPQGEKVLARYQLVKNKKGQRSWDGKWRVIVFDVKEQRRHTRDQLRRELTNFGFRRLQNSVWVFPYPCEEFIILLKADLRIGKDVLFLTTENMENDQSLREQFGLLK